MHETPKADLLAALKQSLHDLENVKLLSPDDLDIVELRRDLKEKIAAIEAQQRQSRNNHQDAA
jgi:hypothetical protein